MSNERPPIEPALKRAVRQKCGFGCVMCGNPICDYDHIDDYADVQEHELDNLTLLCTMHHRQKTNGILSPEIVRERTESIRHYRGGMPDINFPTCKLILGNNTVNSITGNCFQVQGKDFFRIEYDEEADQVLINAAFYDSDGKVVFKVDDNIYWTTDDIWDVEVSGNRIIFREGHRNLLLTITLDGIANVITIHGKIFIDKDHFIELNSKGIQCHGYTFLNECSVEECETGILVAESRVLDQITGAGFRGGRNHQGRAKRCSVGFAIDKERVIGVIDKFPKGKE